MNVAIFHRSLSERVYSGVHSRGAQVSRNLLLVLLLSLGVQTENQALAQVEFSEYEVKAAFIYQFLSYVTWPESKVGTGPLLVGVVGAPQLAGSLSVLTSGQSANGKTIDVRTLTPDADPRDFHVVFIAADLERQSRDLLRAAAANAVLTITERRPRPRNSVINFEVVDGKVRFDVALGLARQNSLDISARLLQVALRVVDEP